MKNRNKYKRIAGSCIAMLCMVCALLFYVKDTEATDGGIEYAAGYVYDAEKYVDNDGEGVAPETPSELSGYLFAGWYTSPDEGVTYNAVKEPQSGEKYYAKFVPAAVLGMKAQVTNDLIADKAVSGTDNSAIRFVTTVDSDQYQEVGFKINRPKSDGTYTTYDTGNGVVYDTLYAVDATKDSPGEADTTYTPSMFHDVSKFFKTWTIKKIPTEFYNADFTVTPYWITFDGTRVEGTQGIKTVNLGRSWIYVDAEATDSAATGTYNEPYTTISGAVAHVTTLSPTVILKDNESDSMAVSETVDIEKNITLTSENSYTLTRKSDFKDEFFYVAGTGALTLKTINDDSELILDGAKSSVIADKAFIFVDGTLNIAEGVTLQNNAHGSGTSTTPDTAYNGGAIYLDDTATLTMTGGTITGNEAIGNGGAIHAAAKSKMSLSNVTLSYNTAAGQAGAINLPAASSLDHLVELKNVKVNNNTATNWASGAIYVGTYRQLQIDGSSTEISDNTAKSYGGAIGVGGANAKVTINNGTFQKNTGANGGAVCINKSATLTIKDGTFSYNTAKNTSGHNGGGAIYAYLDSAVEISNAKFSNNTSKRRGGAIYLAYDGRNAVEHDGALSLTNVSIKDNTASNAAGAIFATHGWEVLIEGAKTEISGNTAGANGGAIVTGQYVDITMTDGTIKNNTANGGEGAGAIYFWSTATATTTFAMSGGTIQDNTDNTSYKAPNINANNTTTIQLSGAAKLESVSWSGGVNDIEVTAPLTAENTVTEITYQSGASVGTTAVTYTGTADVDMQDLCGRFTLTDTGYTLSVSDKTLLLSAVIE